jgi:predicted TIM-barrel fold metal-dependent hydrolase
MIPVREHIDDGLTLSPTELAKRDEVLALLPDLIIDMHAHAGLEDHVGKIDPLTMQHMMSTFPFFTLKDSERMINLLFPGKEMHTIRFAIPWKGIDHRAVNQYLVEQTPPGDKVALCGIADDIDYSINQLRTKCYCGLKMYNRYVEPPVTKIYDFFRPEILEETQALNIPIILHLPLMITQCVDDLERCLSDFPNLRVVLAHLGLPHLPVPGLEEAYGKFAKYPNVFMDTAMIPSSEVVAMSLKAFDSDRIMYGSDQPLNLLRQIVYNHPTKGERIVTRRRYHWTDITEHDEYSHLALNAIHSHWQCLEALLKGIKKVFPDSEIEARHNIFYANARNMFGF